MEFYIGPDGSDSNDGTLESPFASLTGALIAIRKIKTDLSDTDTDIRVFMRTGVYRVLETVVFGLDDSPGEERFLSIEAYPNEKPVLSAGIPITQWRKLALDEEPDYLHENAKGRIWVADLPRVAGSVVTPRSLYRGEKRLPRARGERFSPLADPPGVDPEIRRSSIHIEPGMVAEWPDLRDAEVLVIPEHSWTMNYLPVDSLRNEGTEIRTTVPHTYQMLPSAHANGPVPKAAVWLENSLAVLTSPGEWVVHSAEGRIYYWPEADSPEDGIVAPALTEMVRIEGDIDYDGPMDQPVRGIRFVGLTFMHCDRYPWHGRTGWGVQHDWEAFDRPTAVARFRGAEDCEIRECTFTATSGAAIRCDLHSKHISLRGNSISDIGGVGVFLCGYGPGTKDVNRENTVEGNHIHHVGRITWHAPAIFVWQSGRNRIAHNLIHNTPYTAVVISGRMRWDRDGVEECSQTIRWQETSSVLGTNYEQKPWYDVWYPDWKRREPLYHSRENNFEFNAIHHVMETMGDGNGVYISGAGGGNAVRFNRIHDCPSQYMYEAIRCDDDQHGVHIHGNIIYRLGGAAIGIANKGINHITNNIIACPLSERTGRGMISLEMDRLYGAKVQRNIVYVTEPGQQFVWEGRPLHGDGRDTSLNDCEADWNLYWSTENQARCEDFLSRQRTGGIEINSVCADPRFVDPDAGDFRLQPDSPAIALGFEPIEIDRIGPDADSA